MLSIQSASDKNIFMTLQQIRNCLVIQTVLHVRTKVSAHVLSVKSHGVTSLNLPSADTVTVGKTVLNSGMVSVVKKSLSHYKVTQKC